MSTYPSAVRASNSRSRKKAAATTAGRLGTSFFISATERERRYAQRVVLLTAPPEQKPRIKALIEMGPPSPEEAAALVARFLAERSATVCPPRCAEAIRNGEGFA